jgi:hypothetical protein
MTRVPGSESRAGRFWLVMLGVPAAAALACVSTVGPPLAHLSQSGPRVVAAVRAGYPDLCHEWRDKLVAAPSPASGYTRWDVSCIAGVGPPDYKLMTVDVLTCQWREPLELSPNWHQMLATLTAASQRLRRCP